MSSTSSPPTASITSKAKKQAATMKRLSKSRPHNSCHICKCGHQPEVEHAKCGECGVMYCSRPRCCKRLQISWPEFAAGLGNGTNCIHCKSIQDPTVICPNSNCKSKHTKAVQRKAQTSTLPSGSVVKSTLLDDASLMYSLFLQSSPGGTKSAFKPTKRKISELEDFSLSPSSVHYDDHRFIYYSGSTPYGASYPYNMNNGHNYMPSMYYPCTVNNVHTPGPSAMQYPQQFSAQYQPQHMHQPMQSQVGHSPSPHPHSLSHSHSLSHPSTQVPSPQLQQLQPPQSQPQPVSPQHTYHQHQMQMQQAQPHMMYGYNNHPSHPNTSIQSYVPSNMKSVYSTPNSTPAQPSSSFSYVPQNYFNPVMMMATTTTTTYAL